MKEANNNTTERFKVLRIHIRDDGQIKITPCDPTEWLRRLGMWTFFKLSALCDWLWGVSYIGSRCELEDAWFDCLPREHMSQRQIDFLDAWECADHDTTAFEFADKV